MIDAEQRLRNKIRNLKIYKEHVRQGVSIKCLCEKYKMTYSHIHKIIREQKDIREYVLLT